MPKRTVKPGEFMQPFDVETRTVVTMDLSKTSTAWAIHAPNAKLVQYEAASLKGEKLWHLHDSMRMLVSRILNEARLRSGGAPGLLVVEDAIKQPGYASRVYEVLYLAVTEACGRGLWSFDKENGKAHPVPVAVVAPTQVKAYTLGKDNRRGTPKEAITEAVRALYGLPLDPKKAHPDGDIADAIGVYLAAQALAPAGKLRVAV